MAGLRVSIAQESVALARDSEPSAGARHCSGSNLKADFKLNFKLNFKLQLPTIVLSPTPPQRHLFSSSCASS
jgi:hypothetical protein